MTACHLILLAVYLASVVSVLAFLFTERLSPTIWPFWTLQDAIKAAAWALVPGVNTVFALIGFWMMAGEVTVWERKR